MLGFHLSAIVIFAIIPVAHFLGNLSIKRIFIVFPIILVISMNIDLFALFQNVVQTAFRFNLISSDGYSVNHESLFFAANSNLGLGYYLFLFSSIIVIAKYDTLKPYRLLKGVWLCYLFLFPVVMSLNSIAISRLFMYLSFSNVIVYSIVFKNLNTNTIQLVVKYGLLIIFISYFLVGLFRGAAHSAPYNFSFYA